MTDPVDLTRALIRCPSVTPEEGGALVLLERTLSAGGFACTRVDRGGIANLFARWGEAGNGRVFAFNGHTDVVPPGDSSLWSRDPFGAELADGRLYGRGAMDMKSGVAAFAAAALDFVAAAPPRGSIVLMITGDEEAAARDGTRALLDWMKAKGERIDHCLVGEPTSPERIGEMMKIGRRGSLTLHIRAEGRGGHAAYPARAANPLPVLARFLTSLSEWRMDDGTEHFEPSTLAITGIDTGNTAANVIPPTARAMVNIRFNDAHTADGIVAHVRSLAMLAEGRSGVGLVVEPDLGGACFLTEPGEFTELVARAVKAETGLEPDYSTSGGTSDARFVKDVCPVVEFGLPGKGMHGPDESVAIDDIVKLKAVYARILQDYFS